MSIFDADAPHPFAGVDLTLPSSDIVATTESEAGLLHHLKAFVWLSRTNRMPEGWAYRGPNDLLLKHGTFYDGACILPDEWSGVIHAVPKHCYDNAYRLARASKGGLRYVEGMAAGIIPVPHAWCIDKDDRVVDPTWAELDHHRDGPNAYLGVVVPLPVVARARRAPDNASALWGWGPGTDLMMTQPYSPDLKLPPVAKKAKKS